MKFATCTLFAALALPAPAVAAALPARALAADKPPRLHMAPARNEIHLAMEKKFGALPPSETITTRACDRRSRTRIRCDRVQWWVGDSAFDGWATVQMRQRRAWKVTYRIVHTNEYCADTGGSGCRSVHRG